jgi:threonine/homoserine/homoserine lactone efflux protein
VRGVRNSDAFPITGIERHHRAARRTICRDWVAAPYDPRMSLWSSIFSFAAVAALVTITPGLDTALVLRSALSDGRRNAFATALGINTGVLVWAVGAAVGASALLNASRTAYRALQLVGAAYIVILGFKMLRNSFERTPGGDVAAVSIKVQSSLGRSYRAGVLTNLLNPKIGVFYIALLPQFIPKGSSAVWVGVLLAIVHNIEGLMWFALIIGIAGRARTMLSTRRSQRLVNRLAGSVLIGFGIKLARSKHGFAS